MTIENISGKLAIRTGFISDKGRKEENQDCLGIKIPQDSALAAKGVVMVIADGVSAAECAAEASNLVVKGFLNDYFSTPDSWSVQRSGSSVLKSLNRWLWSMGQSHVAGRGYLTTFSAVILKSDQVHIFHVGDSRIYRYRDGQLKALTRDHVTILSKKESYLARAIGADVTLDMDYKKHSAKQGDVFLATTDGVHDWLQENEIKEIINNNIEDMQVLCEQLKTQSFDVGSNDNISCQALKIEKLDIATEQGVLASLKDLPFPPDLEVGQKIDGLEVKKIIHASERSQIYIVKNEDDQTLVMKTPSVNYQDDPAYIERFIIEEWIGLRVNNPNVVKVIKPKKRTFLYYLTEFLPGQTIRELIDERKQLDIQDTIELVSQMIKGIRALHRKETLHQDLKPENIVLGDNGATIIDFGGCLIASVDEIHTTVKREDALGTLHYSAPEYRYGGVRSAKSDQFSLAVIVYEMLTGQLPYGDAFLKPNRVEQFEKLKYTSAMQHNPLVPIWLDGALRKATSMKPESRYENLSEFLYDLKNPNKDFLRFTNTPLMNRNPVLFWQGISAVLLLLLIVSLAV
ncbi:MAG: bifunctional protein-serine/threonine kinase/phosphatase [Saccharospirillaceae bacterium]|nr:protein kinase [Pseudomonadales bacterium]NRB79697.1 bifunctional protein-serine/threonine kinase/phosphatase [Saccharospirillaceae bacterium]